MTLENNIKRRSTPTSNNNVAYLKDFQPSTIVSNWRKKTLDEIKSYRHPLVLSMEDISIATLDNGEEFIGAMPATLLAPTVGLNDDGSLLIEWSKKENDSSFSMFSVILNSEEMIYSLLYSGSVKTFGAINFSTESLDILRNLLVKYFKFLSILKPMSEDDIASRFLFYSSDINFSNRIIKTSEISGKHPKGYSVFKTTDCNHNEIWSIGKKHVAAPDRNDGRPILGRYDIAAFYFMDANLKIKWKQPPLRHHNIYGMPIPSSIGKAKDLSHRQLIVTNAVLYLISDEEEWEKFGRFD